MLDEFCSNRIEGHVPAEGEEVVVTLNDLVLETALEYVAVALVSFVPPLSVPTVQTANRF